MCCMCVESVVCVCVCVALSKRVYCSLLYYSTTILCSSVLLTSSSQTDSKYLSMVSTSEWMNSSSASSF